VHISILLQGCDFRGGSSHRL